MVTRWVLRAGIATLLGVVLTGCGSGSSDSRQQLGPTASTALVPGTAKIVSFDAPATVKCTGNVPYTTVEVRWKVTGAVKTVVEVDGLPIPGATTDSGSAKAKVHCEPQPHDIVVIATDRNGHYSSDRRILYTTTGAA